MHRLNILKHRVMGEGIVIENNVHEDPFPTSWWTEFSKSKTEDGWVKIPFDERPDVSRTCLDLLIGRAPYAELGNRFELSFTPKDDTGFVAVYINNEIVAIAQGLKVDGTIFEDSKTKWDEENWLKWTYDGDPYEYRIEPVSEDFVSETLREIR